MSFSYREKPDNLSIVVAARLLDIHRVNRAAKTKEFCRKWRLDYFTLQIKNINPRVAATFFELKEKYPEGRIVIFLTYCSFFGSLAIKGSLGFFISDKYNPRIVLVDVESGEKQIHQARPGAEINDFCSNVPEYEEF